MAKPRLRGVSHEVAAFVFPFLGLAAVLAARSAGARVAVAIYAIGVTGMYATSACYHRGDWTPRAKRRMRRLDHSMILVGIASTYTPVAVIGLSSATAWALLSVVWGLAVVGAVVRNLWLGSPRWVTAALYIGVGWTAVAVMPNLWTRLGVAIFVLLAAPAGAGGFPRCSRVIPARPALFESVSVPAQQHGQTRLSHNGDTPP